MSSASSPQPPTQASQPQASTPDLFQKFFASPTAPSSSSDPLPAGVQFSPASERNKADIGAALLSFWPQDEVKRVLEFSSGTGQHVAHFASLFAERGVTFQPSDQNEQGFTSIAYHTREQRNVLLPPLLIDLVKESSWPSFASQQQQYDAAFVANMLHISERGTTAGLFRASALALRPGGFLAVYGPFKRHGAFTTESNAAFDVKLRQMNPEHYGLRDIDADVAAEGVKHGFALKEVKDMPANNFLLLFVKEGGGDKAKAAL
jgi:SAM-dependent methyltransferase